MCLVVNLSKRVLSVLVLGSFFCGSAYSGSDVFTRAESFSNSTANPLTAYLKNLLGPAPLNGNYALSRNNIEFGLSFNSFEISLVHRNDYNLQFSDGARQFAWLSNNPGVQAPYDQYFEVDVWANQYQLTGLKFAYEFEFTRDFQFSLSYAHLYASEAVYGYLGKDPEGVGGTVARVRRQAGDRFVDTLDGDLYTDYYYTHDPFFAREVNPPSGVGYSIDAAFTWRILPNLVVNGKFYDLLGEVHWHDLPRTVADATGENFTYDEEGYLQTHPSFGGNESFSDLNQRLTNRERLSLDYRYKGYALGYEFDRMKVVSFHRVEAGYFWSDSYGVSASYDVTSSAVGLELHLPVGELFFTFDELDMDNAHTLGFGWNLAFQF